MILRRFATTFRRFPKIFQNCSKGQTNVPEHSPKIFKKFPKITEDFRGRPEDVEMIHQRIPSESKYNLRDKLDITEIIDIFTCEDIVSFLSICYHSLYHWLKINYFRRSKKILSSFLGSTIKLKSLAWGLSFLVYFPLSNLKLYLILVFVMFFYCSYIVHWECTHTKILFHFKFALRLSVCFTTMEFNIYLTS